MSRTPVSQKSSDQQTREIEDRISSVEKSFGGFHKLFGSYLQKTGELRDTGDALSKALLEYAVNEKLNQSTSAALKDFVGHYDSVEDYRDALNKRLEAKVVEPLQQYGDYCKKAKADLKATKSARSKEKKTEVQLEKDRQKQPSNRGLISQRESELQRAGVAASRTTKSLEDDVVNFEQRKIADLKKILFNFVHSEMLFHAKSLEMFSLCYNALRTVDEDADLELFMQSLAPNSSTIRQQLARSGSRTSVNSTTSLPAASRSLPASRGNTPQGQRRPPPTPSPPVRRAATSQRATSAPPSAQPRPRAQQQQYESDDDDDDDDSEDYTYDSEEYTETQTETARK